MAMDILFFNQSGEVIAPPQGVTFRVDKWAIRAWGGPAWSEMVASGEDNALGELREWLGYRVLIVDTDSRATWWGKVESATVPAGVRLFHITLSGMANRVAVAYTENSQRYTTAWAQDDESVHLYGVRERLISLDNGREAQANAFRDTSLNVLRQPSRHVATEGGKREARLGCLGAWQTGQVYYHSSQGFERHLAGSKTEKIGQTGITNIGWRFDGNKLVYGSEYHNPETEALQKIGQSAYTATLEFEDGDEGSFIIDPTGGFGAFVAGEVVTVSSSATNNGTYTLERVTATHLKTIEDLDDEAPNSATVTPQSYSAVAQGFRHGGGTLKKVRIKAGVRGTASDGFKCTITPTAPDGIPLSSVTVAAADMNGDANWIEYGFAGGTLNPGTVYWMVFERTGAASAASGYVVAVDESAGYSHSEMRVYNGSAWVTRPTPADMIFEVIYEPTQGLGAFVSGDRVVVSGSTWNEGEHVVTSVESGTTPYSLTVETELVTENLGSSVTVAPRHTKVAQRFKVNDNPGWWLALARIKARWAGTVAPTDGLTLQIHEDDTGDIGTSLALQTVAGADISTTLAWVAADFGTSLALTSGAHYWLSVKRTGTENNQDGYVIQVDDGAGYTDGALEGWTGSAWVARTPSSDMVFELVGLRQTTDLIADILTATGLFAGVDVRVSSGVYASPFYDGDSLAIGEVERLLKQGTSDGTPLIATVTEDQWVRIEAAPSMADAYGMRGDGRLVDSFDRDVTAQRVTAGVWLTQLDLPPTLEGASFAGVSQMFIEEAEYDAGRNRFRLRFLQNRNPLAAGLREG